MNAEHLTLNLRNLKDKCEDPCSHGVIKGARSASNAECLQGDILFMDCFISLGLFRCSRTLALLCCLVHLEDTTSASLHMDRQVQEKRTQ